MVDRSRVKRLLHTKLREAGRQYERARRSYGEGRSSALSGDVPRDDDGRARIVCRRYAEKRAVEIDEGARPACYEAGHPDCEGCVEDLRAGRIETW